MRKNLFAALAVAGLGLLPSATFASALSDSILSDLYGGTGFIEFKYANFDAGTVYNVDPGTYGGAGSTSANSTVGAGETTLDGLPSNPALGTGFNPGEDSWGIARVTSIEDSLGLASLWVPSAGAEMSVMFYGVKDYYVDATGTQQTTNGTGMILDIYLDTTPDYNSNLGSAGRTAFDAYSTVSDGELVLRLVSIGGHINIGTDEGGADAQFKSIFFPSTNTGEGSAYLSVVGGVWASAFDSDVFDGSAGVAGFDPAYAANILAGLDYDPADAYLKFETFPNITNSDWLVRSNDPLRLQLVEPTIPEPITAATGMIALGALSMAATRRRKA